MVTSHQAWKIWAQAIILFSMKFQGAQPQKLYPQSKHVRTCIHLCKLSIHTVQTITELLIWKTWPSQIFPLCSNFMPTKHCTTIMYIQQNFSGTQHGIDLGTHLDMIQMVRLNTNQLHTLMGILLTEFSFTRLSDSSPFNWCPQKSDSILPFVAILLELKSPESVMSLPSPIGPVIRLENGNSMLITPKKRRPNMTVPR